MRNQKSALFEFVQLAAGSALVALGVYFFKFPNHFSFGGVTGLAAVASTWLPVSPADFSFLANMALLALGLAFLGKSFGLKTAYASLLPSLLLSLLHRPCPLPSPPPDQPTLELAFAIALPALGAALLFDVGASGGGTDVIALILKKYSGVSVGKALFCSDLLFVLLGAMAFGVEALLFSFAGLIVKSLVVDQLVASMRQVKYLNVVCSKPEALCQFITNQLRRSATVTEGKGAFTGEARWILFTAMTPGEALRLRQFIRQTDPSSFVMTAASEVMGRGF